MSDDAPPPESPLTPLIVQLLYDEPPQLRIEELTELVDRYCGRTDPDYRPEPGADHAQYFMLDAMVETSEGALPSQLCVSIGEGPRPEHLDAGLAQTWDWPEAESVVRGCSHMLVANDLMAAGLDHKVRSAQFRAFLRAIHELAPCRAMHFIHAEKMVDPNLFAANQDGQLGEQLYGSINVRFYRVSSGGEEGDCLMDTRGLTVLGLPDLQCHYRDLDFGAVARALFGTAFYMYDVGDVIQDGDTIAGIEETDRWVCRREMSLSGPERTVLDINPGPPYAAGNRGD
ncbi:MAG: DUF4261 domain-containing protein [Verrucomicrobia bacterium]|nr:DUF4261 domain-containing protein [Verrucomicrobiota bacterium]